MSDVDWLIIGGGPHGVHLAARLAGEVGIDAARLRILDPGSRLLERWQTFTATTGMSHLRSPGVHHLDLEPFSLFQFAGDRRRRPRGLMRGRFGLPSLELFNAHCDHVIERFGLANLHLRGHAVRLEPRDDEVRVETCEGAAIRSRRVVLAIGAGCLPALPSWAPPDEPRIRHIFEPTASSGSFSELGEDERLIVVGGGISAAQTALRLVGRGRSVDLVTRHPLRVHQFDSDSGWQGPKLMAKFRRVRSYEKRRQIIDEARHRGCMTPAVRQALRAAAASGDLEVHEDEVADLQTEGGDLKLKLESGRVLEGSRLYLATGFASRRPGGRMLDRLVEDFELPCAACGYPVVDAWLRWHPRIHVSGPLAELELGPVSRNIAGARRAGDRLVEAVPRLQAAA